MLGFVSSIACFPRSSRAFETSAHLKLSTRSVQLPSDKSPRHWSVDTSNHFARANRKPFGAVRPHSVGEFSYSADQVKMSAVDKAKKAIGQDPVVVFSKTYCPYCTKVKGLFEELKVKAKIYELDDLPDGDSIQEALAAITGQRTVPNVFIGGNHVGGCDNTVAAQKSGKLKQLLSSAGITI